MTTAATTNTTRHYMTLHDATCGRICLKKASNGGRLTFLLVFFLVFFCVFRFSSFFFFVCVCVCVCLFSFLFQGFLGFNEETNPCFFRGLLCFFQESKGCGVRRWGAECTGSRDGSCGRESPTHDPDRKNPNRAIGCLCRRGLVEQRLGQSSVPIIVTA